MALKSERYSAVFVGCACGDALGMPVETWSRERIKKYAGKVTRFMDAITIRDENGNPLKRDEFGVINYWTRNFKKGEYTDDTILTTALAESIIHSGLDIHETAKMHVSLYEKNMKGGFGGTTIEAIKKLQNGVSPYFSGVIGSPGNGPAMKMAPIGIYADVQDSFDDMYHSRYQASMEFAELVGKMTHLDPRSIASGVVQAHAVHALLQNAERKDFADSLYGTCERFEKPLTPEFTAHERGDLKSRFAWLRSNMDASDEDAYRTLGNDGIVIESYPFALFMMQKYWDDPVNGLIETINFGGDADTTGAMYGALAGARHGMIFPKEWLDELYNKDYLVNLGKQMAKLGDHNV